MFIGRPCPTSTHTFPSPQHRYMTICCSPMRAATLYIGPLRCFSMTASGTTHPSRRVWPTYISAASRNFEKGARSRTHFQKAGQPEYFWATHPFNAKHSFNIYLCITILQEAFISIITNFLFLKNTFKIQKIDYNRFLPFSLVEIKNHEPLAVVNVDHNSSVFINFSILLSSPCVATWSKVKVFKTSWLVQLIEGCI